jgi:regulator of cell morphogenesis and NO signaling
MSTVITLTPATPLGDIVAQNPATAKVLSQHGLDFCCGGQRSLADACAAEGLNTEQILGALTVVPVEAGKTDWTAVSAAELCEHVVSVHHEYLWREMPRISALAAKVARVHGAGHPELKQIATIYQQLVAELTEHLLTEEQEQFPAIIAGSGWSREAINELMTEHDAAGDLLVELRRLSSDYAVPADGCGSYRLLYSDFEELENDLHLHIHKENNILFPALLK